MGNTPNIRFKGFTEEWEQRKLGDLCERITRKNKNAESDLPLTIASQYGLIDQRDFFNKVVAAKDMSNYYLLKKGEFAYNKSYSKGYDYGSIKRLNAYEQGCLSTLYICFGIISDEIESDYMECFFETLKWYSDIKMICAEGARNHGLLNVDTKAFFDEVTIEMPSSKDEQKNISAYLNNLDNLITLHQRKCNETKKLKKYMLQKMFPKNGEKKPEIRFEGFTDDWEQRKLGDLVTFSKGSGYSKGDLKEEGTPIILYGRLYTKYETVISDVDTFVDAKENSVYSKGGEVIVPGSGETAEDISIASVVEKSGVLLGGDLNVINPPEEINPVFLAISISNGKPHKDMAKMAQGKSVVHLHNSDLAKIDFPFPSYEEQCRISNHFSELDNLITLHQRKCDELKEIKKYMLQNMFPKKGD